MRGLWRWMLRTFSAARQDFETVLKRNPRHPDALNNKAQSEMSQGLLRDSQESFFRLLRSGQRVSSYSWHYCTVVLVPLGARSWVDSQIMEAHLGLTELYQASGNVTAALKHYDEIFKVQSARVCAACC
jgi:hypothetical protein